MKALLSEELNVDIIYYITSMINSDVDSFPLVGCSLENHKNQLTKNIIRFFIIMRMHFIVKKGNYRDTAKKNRYVSKLQ